MKAIFAGCHSHDEAAITTSSTHTFHVTFVFLGWRLLDHDHLGLLGEQSNH